MRMKLLPLALAAALALPGVAGAQQSLPTEPPANPRQVVPDQRLENVNQRLLNAAETLHKAAESGNEAHAADALALGRQTVSDVRAVFADLPQDQRAAYEEAFSTAEQALARNDPRAGATAMQDLRRRVLDLVAGKG
jgi:hypothetical protein